VSNLVPDRFIVTAIVREVDDDGTVIAERQTEPVVCFSTEQLVEWAGMFPEKLVAARDAGAIAG
jgi:hypothetical protein